MNTNYEYYKFFYYTAKYKSLTIAAEKLHSNQPNASRVIKLLEDELGCTLFTRSRNGMELTANGERLYKHIKIAVEKIIEAEDELVNNKKYAEENIHLTVSGSVIHFMLPIIARYREVHPEVRIHVMTHTTKKAKELIEKGESDVAVIVGASDVKNPLKSTHIVDLNDILVGGPIYKELSKSEISIMDIRKYPLVSLPENTGLYLFFEEQFRKYGADMRADIIADTLNQQILFIMYNLGVGFIPEATYKESVKTAELYKIPLVEHFDKRPVSLVENTVIQRSKTITSFIDFIIEETKKN